MEGEVGEEGLECILVKAMCAAKNLAAQRDRLLHLRRQLQQRSPGDDDAGEIQEFASGLHKLYSTGLHYASCYLADCLEIAAENIERISFSIPTFAYIPNEQMYGVLLSQWHNPRPTRQVQAFARIESAYYAVMLSLEHHLPRCIELLVGVRPPSVLGEPVRTMIGYSDDPVNAAIEHLRKRFEAGFTHPDTAPAAAAATDERPQAERSVDVDQALSYFHRACSLTSLALKNMDVAIPFISSLLDPELVAEMSEWNNKRACISEDGPYPYPSDDPDERADT